MDDKKLQAGLPIQIENDSEIVAPQTVESTNVEPQSSTEAFLSGFNEWNGNIITSIARTGERLSFLAEEGSGYNVWADPMLKDQDPELVRRYESYIGSANSKIDLITVLGNIHKTQRQMQIADFSNEIQSATGDSNYFAGALLGAILNPLNLIPMGAYTKAGTLVGTTAKGAASGAALGGGAIATNVMTAETTTAPTTEEQVTAIGIGAGAGAVLGGVTGLIIQKLNAPIKVSPPESKITASSFGSAGAAGNDIRFRGPLVPEESPYKVTDWMFSAARKWAAFTSPAKSVEFNSKSRTAQLVSRALTGSTVKMKNLNADESMVALEEQLHVAVHRDKAEIIQNIADVKAKFEKRTGQKISTKDFEQLLTSRIYFEENKGIQEIEDLLNKHHKPTTDRWLQTDKDVNLLPKDYQNPNEFYMPVRFDLDAIRADRPNWINTLSKALGAEKKRVLDSDIKIIKEDLDKLELQLTKQKQQLNEKNSLVIKNKQNPEVYYNQLKQISELETALKKIKNVNGTAIIQSLQELKGAFKAANIEIPFANKISKYTLDGEGAQYTDLEIAEEITDNLFKNGDSLTTFNSSKLRPDALKLRELSKIIKLKDVKAYVKQDDYVETMWTAIKDHHKARLLKENFGDIDLTAQSKVIHSEYQDLLDKIKKDLDEGKISQKAYDKEKRALLDREAEDVKMLRGMVNRFLGGRASGRKDYSSVDALVDTTQTVTHAKLGQTMAFAQFPDFAPIIVDMADSEFGQGLAIMAKDIGIDLSNNVKLGRINKNTLKQIGLIAEDQDMLAMSRLEAGGEDLASQHKVGRFNQRAKQFLFKAQGMKMMNDVTQQLAAPVAEQRVLDVIGALSADKATKKINALAQRIGISPMQALKFRDQFAKHATTENGILWSNWEKWDHSLGTEFAAAIKTYDSAHLALQKGIGTMPLWADEWYGKLFAQYKSYTFRIWETMMLKDLQDADAAAGMRFVLKSALGSVSYAAKASLAGVQQADWSPQRVAYESVMRGGALSGVDNLVYTLHNVANMQATKKLDKYLGNKFGYQPFKYLSAPYTLGIADPKLFYRNQDSFTDQMTFGASIVIQKDLARIIDGDLKENDLEQLGKYFMPWYVQGIYNNVFDKD